jgi:hypothetical protein
MFSEIFQFAAKIVRKTAINFLIAVKIKVAFFLEVDFKPL